MILTGKEIASEVDKGRIRISPYTPAHITPTSYDLTLGDTVLRYKDAVLDPKHPPQSDNITMPPDGFRLNPGEFVLGHSVEEVGSDFYAGLIHARSGIARLGLFVHVTSDLIHTGSYGQVTFQFYATLPVTLKPGMPVGQITFWQPQGEIELYRGRYHGQQGVRASEIYRDFEGK